MSLIKTIVQFLTVEFLQLVIKRGLDTQRINKQNCLAGEIVMDQIVDALTGRAMDDLIRSDLQHFLTFGINSF